MFPSLFNRDCAAFGRFVSSSSSTIVSNLVRPLTSFVSLWGEDEVDWCVMGLLSNAGFVTGILVLVANMDSSGYPVSQ